jgi:RNA polymerase sigma-70 factor, ECF subfamily
MAPLSTESIWSHLSLDLRRFIRRRVPDDHLADDLLQDTFVRIHRSLATLHEEERFAAWVFQIARNAIRDHFRRIPACERLPGDDIAETADEPLDELLCRVSEWMPGLIAQLPEHYREAITLSEIEGLTQQVVADRLGITLSGAKSRVQRGRALLREILDRCCAFQFDHAGRLMNCEPRPDRRVCKDCGDE